MASGIKVESGIQLLARLSKKRSIEKFYPIIFGNGPKYGDFIELYCEENTNYLLVELICSAIIPQILNGPEVGVIVFNTDGNLCLNTIVNFLRKKITHDTNYLSKNNIKDVDVLLMLVLKNLYVLEIFDSTQFYISIQDLENLLTEHPNISLVVFHTLTAFYWSEQDYTIMKKSAYLKKLLSIIRKVIKNHKIAVIYSRPEYFSNSKEPIDNLQSCCQYSTEEQINYRVQIAYNSNGFNVINVRTYDNQFQKQFHLLNDEIVWL